MEALRRPSERILYDFSLLSRLIADVCYNPRNRLQLVENKAAAIKVAVSSVLRVHMLAGAVENLQGTDHRAVSTSKFLSSQGAVGSDC
jgi:hypothetical protein